MARHKNLIPKKNFTQVMDIVGSSANFCAEPHHKPMVAEEVVCLSSDSDDDSFPTNWRATVQQDMDVDEGNGDDTGLSLYLALTDCDFLFFNNCRVPFN